MKTLKRGNGTRIPRVAVIGFLSWVSGSVWAETLPPTTAIAAPVPAVAVEAPPSRLPSQELTARWVYQLLLAEIAVQRGHLPLATKTYVDLARTTKDPRVARRATEVALYAHDLPAAQSTLSLWLKEDPQSPSARETLGALIMSQPSMPSALPLLTQLIEADKGGEADDFMGLTVLLDQQPDHAAALELARQLTKSYQDMPEAHYLVGSVAAQAGDDGQALKEVREALALRPDWGTGIVLEGRLLQKKSPDQVLSLYQSFVEKHPENREVRLEYARALVENKQYAEGRTQFQTLLQADPNQPDLLLAVGLLDLQLMDYAPAEEKFQAVLKGNYRDPDRVRFYLGQAEEEQHHPERAIQWYEAVESSEQRPLAQIRAALLLAQQGQVQNALDRLSKLPATTPERLEQRTLAQEQIQRDAGDYNGAFDTLNQALLTVPDAPDLLYERAIVADKLNRLDVLEQDLRRVIALRPDYAHAYNALGYSLAEHNVRLDEASTLIHKALSLSPTDPFIIDSLGWVQYRQGNFGAAVTTLKQAYAADQDPEIASHLGEALWASGNEAEARQIWETNLKAHPDNSALLATVHRFLH
ncbi:MAG: tetratricopeptide repeat protein [Ferrovum sp.]|nr:tetratricopeptide repeat protein [Ferrovum sp.]NDU87887.1 tetratricopeptide repeat protein [Ferrovum sp.]